MPNNRNKRTTRPEHVSKSGSKRPRHPAQEETTDLAQPLPEDFISLGQNKNSMIHCLVKEQRYELLAHVLTTPHIQRQINRLDENGETAFGLACRLGYRVLVTLFLEKTRCDINLSAIDQINPLAAAVTNGHCDIVELLLKEPRIILGNQWSSCMALAIEKGRTSLIDQLMNILMEHPVKNQYRLDSYNLPLDSPADPLAFLTITYKYGICFKAKNTELDQQPSWYQDALQNSGLPAIRPIPDRLDSPDDLPISNDTLRALCLLSSYQLNNWLQGFMNTHSNGSRLTLNLLRERYWYETKQNLPFWNKSSETLILCNDVGVIGAQIHQYGVAPVLVWTNLVIKAPETFLFHETYKSILKNLVSFLNKYFVENTQSSPTKSGCSFFSTARAHESQCIRCVTNKMRADPFMGYQ